MNIQIQHTSFAISFLKLTNTLLSQIRLLWYIHLGNVSQDPVSRFHISHVRLPQRRVELAGFHCSCAGVSCNSIALPGPPVRCKRLTEESSRCYWQFWLLQPYKAFSDHDMGYGT